MVLCSHFLVHISYSVYYIDSGSGWSSTFQISKKDPSEKEAKSDAESEAKSEEEAKSEAEAEQDV